MIDMTKYYREDIEDILQISYYDRRTDYVWKHIMGDAPELENKLYPIPSLDSFKVMHYMQKKRTMSVSDFLTQWKEKPHPGLIDCTYNKRSGILRLKARSFDFIYRTKLNQGLFVAHPDVAKSIGLQDMVSRKQYRKSGMYTLAHLTELDEQLYSRYAERLKVKKWKESPQFDIDCQYCSEMIPFIMEDAEKKRELLNYDQRLNIILKDENEVRIGIIRDYSPTEMIAMPVFPRSEWKEGIRSAFAALEQEYNRELEQRTIELQQWCDELSKILLGKTPFCVDAGRLHYSSQGFDTYTDLVLKSALGIEKKEQKATNKLDTYLLTKGLLRKKADVDTSRCYDFPTFHISFCTEERYAVITLKPEIAAALNYEIENKVKIPHNMKLDTVTLEVFDYDLQDSYHDYLAAEKRKLRPQHELLIEEVKYIIQQSAPLLAYSGTNQKILDLYSMNLLIEGDDTIRVMVDLCTRNESKSFDLDNYRTAFRVWWSQLMLKECKYAKECTLDPAHHNPFVYDLPF